MSEVTDLLRRGCRPVTRPVDELVCYTRALERIVCEQYGIHPAFLAEVHDYVCPHWCDVLEVES